MSAKQFVKFIFFMQFLTWASCTSATLFMPITLQITLTISAIILAVTVATPFIATAFEWWMDE